MTDDVNLKNALTRLSYQLNQTTRPELAIAIVDALACYATDEKQFKEKSIIALEKVCQFKTILPKKTYLLALAAIEQLKQTGG